MASYTISGPSSSVGNFPYPFETFKLIISLGYMVLGTAIPLALLQLENHLGQYWVEEEVARKAEHWEQHGLFYYCCCCCCHYVGPGDN